MNPRPKDSWWRINSRAISKYLADQIEMHPAEIAARPTECVEGVSECVEGASECVEGVSECVEGVSETVEDVTEAFFVQLNVLRTFLKLLDE